MITDADIKKLSHTFATKQEILDVKADIKKLSQTSATKKELRDVKNELSQKIGNLAQEVETNNLITAKSFADVTQELHEVRDDIKSDTKELKEYANKANSSLEKISNTLDFILGEIRNLQTENVTISSWRGLIADHEDRIVKLERSQSPH